MAALFSPSSAILFPFCCCFPVDLHMGRGSWLGPENGSCWEGASRKQICLAAPHIRQPARCLATTPEIHEPEEEFLACPLYVGLPPVTEPTKLL